MAFNSAGESRRYEDIEFGGNARGILGDVHGDVYLYSSKLSPSSVETFRSRPQNNESRVHMV
jgi:hypothetical protein